MLLILCELDPRRKRRKRSRLARVIHVDGRAKCNSAPRNSPDYSLRLPIVTNGAPRRLQTRADRRVRHDTTLPDLSNHLVVAYKVACVLEQKVQKIKDLQFD